MYFNPGVIEERQRLYKWDDFVDFFWMRGITRTGSVPPTGRILDLPLSTWRIDLSIAWAIAHTFLGWVCDSGYPTITNSTPPRRGTILDQLFSGGWTKSWPVIMISSRGNVVFERYDELSSENYIFGVLRSKAAWSVAHPRLKNQFLHAKINPFYVVLLVSK